MNGVHEGNSQADDEEQVIQPGATVRNIHAAELATGPKLNQIATAVITTMMAMKIRTLMASLRAVILGPPSYDGFSREAPPCRSAQLAPRVAPPFRSVKFRACSLYCNPVNCAVKYGAVKDFLGSVRRLQGTGRSDACSPLVSAHRRQSRQELRNDSRSPWSHSTRSV